MSKDQDLLATYLPYLPPALQSFAWRAHPLDGKLLLFEREQGLNALLEGEETTHLRRLAPRTLLIAVTNACNLSCHFCYRDLSSASSWRYDTLLEFCQAADAWGVLEVAFGGGEPTIFPQWAEFIQELYATSHLCINFTTNGLYLTDEFLTQIAGKYGQMRVSLYDTNNWEVTIARLVEHQTRFGVNWLITPDELAILPAKVDQLLRLGVRDFLFLSYKGNDYPELHLKPYECEQLAVAVRQVHQTYGNFISLKMDICWGDALPNVPHLFPTDDCGAGDEFLSITSDKQLKPCSFHQIGIPFETLADVRHYWEQNRQRRLAASLVGCARLPERGLNGGHNHEIIPVATIQ